MALLLLLWLLSFFPPTESISFVPSNQSSIAPSANSSTTAITTTPQITATIRSSFSASTRAVTKLPNISKTLVASVNSGGNCFNGGSCCMFKINIPAATHKYIGAVIIILFIIGQTIHYFYLEEKKAKEFKANEPEGEKLATPVVGDHQDEEEEKERRERLAYGISTNSYLVAESKTPGGRVTKVLEKRPRRSFALAPPITPASINGVYESRVKTVQKEEMVVCQWRVAADKWGRGPELLSLINDTEVPSSLATAEEKAKFAMELVQGHVEKMTEQKVFLHGFLEDRHRILCGSENLESEMLSEVRLDLKLEMTAPVPLLISVFLVKVEPQIEQPKTAAPGRASELTSIPNKETPRGEKQQTTEPNNKGKSTVSLSLQEKLKEAKTNPDKKKPTERKEVSSRRKTAKKTSEVSEAAPLLQQVVQGEKPSKEKNVTSKPSSAPITPAPEKPPSGQMPPSILKKKKRDSISGKVLNSSPT